MPLIVNSSIVQFADDVKVFWTIKIIEDFHQFQQDINALSEWSIWLTVATHVVLVIVSVMCVKVCAAQNEIKKAV